MLDFAFDKPLHRSPDVIRRRATQNVSGQSSSASHILLRFCAPKQYTQLVTGPGEASRYSDALRGVATLRLRIRIATNVFHSTAQQTADRFGVQAAFRFAQNRARTKWHRLDGCAINPRTQDRNPQGFDGFDVFSQDVRRMSSGGSFELWPAESQSDVDWAEFVVPGMLRFNVLPRPPNIEHASAFLFDCTGGVLDFLAKVLTQAQLLAIRMGRDQITRSEIVAAYHSPVLRPLHSLIRGLVERKADQLRSFEDVPVELLAERWARAKELRETEVHSEGIGHARASTQGKSREATREARTHYQKGAARYKAKITAGKRRDNRAKELEANLSPEDIRANGRKEALLGNFSLMQRDINRKKQ